MSHGLEKHPGARISFGKIAVRMALVLSILAVSVIILIVLTTSTANKLMSVEQKEISNIPSNVLPSYSPTSFKSFDNQTNLSGWFFKTSDPDPISTIIVVHDTGSNRMPFNVDMVDMIEDFLDMKYNVFLFDLRNSGESEGAISGYGYLEWQDVIGAINHVKKISVTTDVILYGIGSGCSASLLALNKLPSPSDDHSDYPDDILALSFDRSYCSGIILDSPAKNTDDYIRPFVVKESKLGFITQYFVPYAIRVSSGVSSSTNLATEIARLPIPVCIIYGGRDTFIGTEKIEQIVDERTRLNPNTTLAKMFSGAGYVESYYIDSQGYRDTVKEYLTVYFQ
ncbi:MAG TPA: hypothetical protein PK567_03490 [Bacillota bacterium]|nr:hypothetical protein [Bacillota bacterium]